MNGRELIEALNSIEKEKGIDKETIFSAIETSLINACKKNYGTAQNIRVDINRETGDIGVYAQKKVVEDEDYYDGFLEISLDEARKINPEYEIGDSVDFEIKPKDFGRISAQAAKQVVVQKFREAEKEKMYNEFASKERDIDTAIVERIEPKKVIVNLGKANAVLPLNEQIPGETFEFGERIKVYISKVAITAKGFQITVSRKNYELVKRLFELEAPEIYDGTVEIKSIAREAGSRTKIAVYSNREGVDAVGACVGQNGTRVDAIVNELRGEKIDIIPWSDDPVEFIKAALRPSKVIAVEVDELKEVVEVDEDGNEKVKIEKTARAVVPDTQLSLAIGKAGQNVRLAAKLTGWKIDIKSESQARLTNFVDFSSIDGLEAAESYEAVYDEEAGYEESSETYNDVYGENNEDGFTE
jgi:N utilization substance protein A